MKLVREINIANDILEKYIIEKITDTETDIFINGNNELQEVIETIFPEYQIELKTSRLGLVYFKNNQKNILKLHLIVPSMKYKEVDVEIESIENIRLLHGSLYFSVEFKMEEYHLYPVLY
jgi:hypothetical protein